MTTKLVTAMIPSRKRVQGLRYTIGRLCATAPTDQFDILVRIDEDDQESIEAAPQIEKDFPSTRVIVGGRKLGYESLDQHFYAQLEDESQTPWVWIAGDDMDVHGPWFEKLKEVPKTGFIVQPEVSQLNASVYRRAKAQAFPIFPKHCWKKFTDKFPRPFDVAGSNLLEKNGWKTWFLPGVTFIHNEATPEELEKHRKL
jgi:hypothetical protein